MTNFSDLFKDKINSPILREYVEQLVRDMTDLKRENYYAMIKVEERNSKIQAIENALIELKIEFKKEYDEGDEYDFSGDLE